MSTIRETLQNSALLSANVPTDQMFTVDSLASLPPRGNPLQNFTRDASAAYLKQRIIESLKPLHDMVVMLSLAAYCPPVDNISDWAYQCRAMMRQINPAMELAFANDRVLCVQFRPGPVVANPTNAAIDQAVAQGTWFIELRAHNTLLESVTLFTLAAALRWLIVTSQEQHSGRYDLPHGVYRELSDMPPPGTATFEEGDPSSADRPATPQNVRQIVID